MIKTKKKFLYLDRFETYEKEVNKRFRKIWLYNGIVILAAILIYFLKS